jgi:hypothetical protein
MKTANILIGLVAGASLIAVGSWIGLSRPSSIEKNINIPREDQKEERVFLTIDDGRGELKNFGSPLIEKMTAFDLLKKIAEGSNIELKTKSYEIGVLVESIGDRTNGQEEKYWMYYVNGEMPNIASDKKEINPGDKIEFKFEKPSF